MYALCASGTVHTQGFVWKFLCTRHKFSFIHSTNEQQLRQGSTKVAAAYLSAVSWACHPGGQRAGGRGAGAEGRSAEAAQWDWHDTGPPAATQTP